MLIAIDIDDVCADLLPAWIARYNAAYHDQLDYRLIADWDLVPYVRPECGEAIYRLLTDDLYDVVEPVPGALEAVDVLRAAGHRVIFVTAGAPLGHGGQGEPQRKRRWLREWSFLHETGPLAEHGDYVEAYDKGLIRADVLIDDKPANCEAFAAANGCAILFARGHNRAYVPGAWIERADNWRDVRRLLLPDDQGQASIKRIDRQDLEALLHPLAVAEHPRAPRGAFATRGAAQPLPAGVCRCARPQSVSPAAALPAGQTDANSALDAAPPDRVFTGLHADPAGPELIGHDRPEDMAAHGVKFDTNKPRFDLVPPGPMLEVAQLFTKGCQKYDARNWEKGMPWGKVYRALETHAKKFWLGFEADEETGLSHLASVVWCALVLMEYGVTRRSLDDRPRYTAEQRDDFLALLEVD